MTVMYSPLLRFLTAASAVSFVVIPLRAAWTGTAGNNLINDTANWTGGVIDGVFDGNLGATTTLQMDADLTFANGLTFAHADGFSLYIEPSEINATRRITLQGDISVNISGTDARTIRFGSAGGARPIVFDLDGGTRTLAVNTGAAATALSNDTVELYGDITNGNFVKTGGGSLTINNALSINGAYVHEGGFTRLNGTASMTTVNEIVVGGMLGRFMLAGWASDRINDSAVIHLAGGIFGSHTNGGSETLGTVRLDGARSAIGLTSGTLRVTKFERDAYSTVALVGNANSSGVNYYGNGTVKFLVTDDANILSSLSGAGGAAGSTTISILPWATAANAVSGSLVDSLDSKFYGAESGFVTYTSAGGFRALNKTTEYVAGIAASANAADNVRLTAAETLGGTKTINALYIDGATSLNLGGHTLNVTSGALAFGNHALGISNGTINFGTKTGFMMTGRTNNQNISAVLAGSGGVVFGITPDQTFTVSGANTYTGRTVVNSGTLALGANDTLPTGTAVRVDKTGTLRVNNNVSQQVAAISGSGVVQLQNTAARLDVGDSFANSAAGFVTVGDGGSVTVGDDAGYYQIDRLTFTGASLRFESGSALNIQIAALDSFDSINLSTAGKTFAIDGGTLTLSFLDGFTPETGDTFQLFSVGGLAVQDSVLNPDNFTIVSNVGYEFSLDGTGLLVVGAAIPEPSAFVLLSACSVLGFAAMRRRRA